MGLTVSCARDEEPLGPPPGEPVLCSEGQFQPVRAAGRAPAETYDYLAIRSRQGAAALLAV